MNTLPSELIDTIYEYDGRYRDNYNNVVQDINNRNNWFSVKKETVVSSMINYYMLLTPDEQKYLMNTQELTFSKFYFSHK